MRGLVLEVSAPSALGKVRAPMAAVGFLRRMWEKADLGGRLALIGSDGYGVLAHSVHGMEHTREVRAVWRTLFFLIQKERAIAPNSETFSFFFINPGIRSADVLKKCALIALRVITEEGRDGDFKFPSWEKNGKWAARRVQSGRVKTKLGRNTKVCLPPHLTKAVCATRRCTSSGCMGPVTRSLFSCRIGSWQRSH